MSAENERSSGSQHKPGASTPSDTGLTPNKETAGPTLSESQSLAGIVDSAMDAIITVNAQQVILVFNRAAEKMFQCPAAEAIGQALDRFLRRICVASGFEAGNRRLVDIGRVSDSAR